MKKICIGSKVSIKRTVNNEDVKLFAELSMDYNLVHFDDDFASNTIFRKRIAHGMIGVSLISGGLTKLMGDGNIWLSQSINFLKPIFIGDTLTAHLEVRDLDRRKVANIEIKIINDRSEVVIEGQVRSMQFYN